MENLGCVNCVNPSARALGRQPTAHFYGIGDVTSTNGIQQGLVLLGLMAIAAIGLTVYNFSLKNR